MESSEPRLDNSAAPPADGASDKKSLKARRRGIEARLFKSMAGTMERMSWEGCRRTGSLVGLVYFKGVRWRREATLANVQLAFPGIGEKRARQIARRAAQNFCMTMCEFMHLRTASAREIRDYVEFEGLEAVPPILEQGRGFILLSAHFGNWEAVAARCAQEFPLTVVMRPRSNPGLQQCIDAVRHAVGVQQILKLEAARAALRVMQANGALGLLPDEYAWRDGELFPMFGHLTRFTISPARLTLMARVPIVPVFGVRRSPWLSDGRIIARIPPVLHLQAEPGQREAAVHEGTRRIIEQIEDIVRQYPEQWMWPHDRWKAEDLELESQTLQAASET
ncbi:MAG: lysophospholipid acyltransferase family protein [Armatimonadota bacterium]|nr:lysophospholipid acyltransferase family protein [Armatimonadota bacterium]